MVGHVWAICISVAGSSKTNGFWSSTYVFKPLAICMPATWVANECGDMWEHVGHGGCSESFMWHVELKEQTGHGVHSKKPRDTQLKFQWGLDMHTAISLFNNDQCHGRKWRKLALSPAKGCIEYASHTIMSWWFEMTFMQTYPSKAQQQEGVAPLALRAAWRWRPIKQCYQSVCSRLYWLYCNMIRHVDVWWLSINR